MKYLAWLLSRLKRQLWWQAVLYGLLGIVTALIATFAEQLIPVDLPFEISRDAIDSLLGIIASSMLGVTTFSLGAMSSAFSSASSGVTPRATKLLIEDSVTQNVLSTFIGAFVFSIVGIVVTKTGSYGPHGRAVLFLITIVMIGLLVVQLLRWVNHLMSLGRSGNTISRLEAATSQALRQEREAPYLGAKPWLNEDIPEGLTPVYAKQVGYVQFIDTAALDELCQEQGLEAWIPVNTGSFTYDDSVLAWLRGPVTDELADAVKAKFVFEVTRTFDQDPRFGLIALAEVGSRALSPATNDPGTALDILSRQTRLLTQWAQKAKQVEILHPRLHVRPIKEADLFEDAFFLMARDGAHLIEIQLRLQKSLKALQSLGDAAFKDAAKQQSLLAMERAEQALSTPSDLKRLKQELAKSNESFQALT